MPATAPWWTRRGVRGRRRLADRAPGICCSPRSRSTRRTCSSPRPGPFGRRLLRFELEPAGGARPSRGVPVGQLHPRRAPAAVEPGQGAGGGEPRAGIPLTRCSCTVTPPSSRSMRASPRDGSGSGRAFRYSGVRHGRGEGAGRAARGGGGRGSSFPAGGGVVAHSPRGTPPSPRRVSTLVSGGGSIAGPNAGEDAFTGWHPGRGGEHSRGAEPRGLRIASLAGAGLRLPGGLQHRHRPPGRRCAGGARAVLRRGRARAVDSAPATPRR